MTRHHLAPLHERILAVLHAGECDTTALRHRLQSTQVARALKQLEAAGMVRRVQRHAFATPSVWALVPRSDA
jgi:predicted transcriptional regulator